MTELDKAKKAGDSRITEDSRNADNSRTAEASQLAEKAEISLPIGFMDSGLGGLSVLRAAVRLMPSEDFLYFGDSANAPYGVRPEEEIRELTYAVVERLMEQGIKGLAVACNTATGAAVRPLREKYPDLPIVGIEPAVKPAAELSNGGRILVMATPMTIATEKYRRLLLRFQEENDIVSVPCAGLMEYVEQGTAEEKDLEGYFREHLLPFLTPDTETIVLGCTHYPFIRRELRAFLQTVFQNDRIRIIDGSLGTARELKRRLSEKGLLRTEERKGIVRIENSSPDPEMIRRSCQLLRMPEEAEEE